MSVTSRPFSGNNDFRLLKEFVTSVMQHDMQHSYWHVGDVIWGLYQNTIFDPSQNVRIWENERRELLGFAWRESHVSYCICWLDPVNKIGEFEPVGTSSAFRGKGLGKAIMLEGLRRLRAFGMQTAIVCTGGDNEVARNLYESAGFRVYNRSYDYSKQLTMIPIPDREG